MMRFGVRQKPTVKSASYETGSQIFGFDAHPPSRHLLSALSPSAKKIDPPMIEQEAANLTAWSAGSVQGARLILLWHGSTFTQRMTFQKMR
eukprot:scaffold8993_cov207-Skeletonema_marinoi.AAC.15